MDIKKINFKQPKYLLPAIIYLPPSVCRLFHH